MGTIVAICWGIWSQRNGSKFENKAPNFNRLCSAIISWVKESSYVSKGPTYNSVSDLLTIKKFGVECCPPKAPKVLQVQWYPPLSGWVKCNTNGGLLKPI